MSIAKPWQLTGGEVFVISGSRTIRSYWLFSRHMRELLKDRSPNDTILLQGEAKFGIDRLARIFAKRNGWKNVGWPAAWDTQGRRAGMIRNATMMLHADHLIAAWDGVSNGTKHAISVAEAKKIPTDVVMLDASPDAEDRNIQSLVKYRRLGDPSRSKIRIKG